MRNFSSRSAEIEAYTPDTQHDLRKAGNGSDDLRKDSALAAETTSQKHIHTETYGTREAKGKITDTMHRVNSFHGVLERDSWDGEAAKDLSQDWARLC